MKKATDKDSAKERKFNDYLKRFKPMELQKTIDRKKKTRRLKALAVLLLAVLFFSGCNGVRRRLTITSNPEGATVYLNDREIGQTPISQNIVYSGTYKIRLAKEGMETKTVMHDVRTPWYLWPGVDFVSENLVPGEIRDNQSCHVDLSGKRVIPDNELYDNAVAMRNEAHNQANLRHYQGNAAGLVPQVSNTPANTPSSLPAINPPNTSVERSDSGALAADSNSPDPATDAVPAHYQTEPSGPAAAPIRSADYLFSTPSL